MNCTKCNGRMVQYAGFNQAVTTETPWECINGCDTTPTRQTQNQQSGSHQATGATVQTQPGLVYLYRGVPPLSLGPTSNPHTFVPSPDPDDSALRTHLQQGANRLAKLDSSKLPHLTQAQIAQWWKCYHDIGRSRKPMSYWDEYHRTPLDKLTRICAEIEVALRTPPRLWCTKPDHETSTCTADSHSPSQTSTHEDDS